MKNVEGKFFDWQIKLVQSQWAPTAFSASFEDIHVNRKSFKLANFMPYMNVNESFKCAFIALEVFMHTHTR